MVVVIALLVPVVGLAVRIIFFALAAIWLLYRGLRAPRRHDPGTSPQTPQLNIPTLDDRDAPTLSDEPLGRIAPYRMLAFVARDRPDPTLASRRRRLSGPLHADDCVCVAKRSFRCRPGGRVPVAEALIRLEPVKR